LGVVNLIAALLGAIVAIGLSWQIVQFFAVPMIDLDDSYYADPGAFIDPPVIYKKIKVNNITLNVATCGNKNGELLIFLHGVPETGRLGWYHQLNYFCNKGYFVLAPDNRGFNTSYKAPCRTGYSTDKTANDIVGLIKYFDRSNAYIVSHDFGGAVGWWLGIFYPQYVKKLVVLNCPHPVAFRNHLQSSLTQLRKSWYIFFFQLPFFPEYYLSKNNYQTFANALIKTVPKGFTKRQIQSYKQAWREPGAVNGLVNWYREVLQGNKKEKQMLKENNKVKAQTLVIWGTNDAALDTQMSKTSFEFVEKGKIELIEASHFVQHDKPDTVNKLVEQFINK